MPSDSPSRSELFGPFRTVSERLDYIDSLLSGGGGPSNPDLLVHFFTNEVTDLSGGDFTMINTTAFGDIPRAVFDGAEIRLAPIEGPDVGQTWLLTESGPCTPLLDIHVGDELASLVTGEQARAASFNGEDPVTNLIVVAFAGALAALQATVAPIPGYIDDILERLAVLEFDVGVLNDANLPTRVDGLEGQASDLWAALDALSDEVDNLPGPVRSVASFDPIRVVDAGMASIAEAGNLPWDDGGLREHDGVAWDEATGQYVCFYSTIDNEGEPDGDPVRSSIALSTSPDGVVWSGPGSDPVLLNGEDPCVARNSNGTMYRDGSNRALIFYEEKDYATHRGVMLARSGPDDLNFTVVGRVLDRGSVGEWDETDRTSPTVFAWDGTLYMLYEGRSLPGQDGQVGLATSDDEGVTWVADPNPIITGGRAGSWNALGSVPDDIRLIGGLWVLLAHDPNGDNLGRYATSVDPSLWGPESFAEMPGNPILHGGATTVAIFDDDFTRVVYDLNAYTLKIGVVQAP